MNYFERLKQRFTPVKLFIDMAPLIASPTETGKVVAAYQLLPEGADGRIYVCAESGAPMYVSKTWVRPAPHRCPCGDTTPPEQWTFDESKDYPRCPTCRTS